MSEANTIFWRKRLTYERPSTFGSEIQFKGRQYGCGEISPEVYLRNGFRPKEDPYPTWYSVRTPFSFRILLEAFTAAKTDV